MQYLSRTIEKVLLVASHQFKAILLTGLRQTGKSTTLQHLLPETRTYITLDNLDTLALAHNAPERFFSEQSFPLAIDEIQRAPHLFLALKERLDKENNRGLVWLTGSQKPRLMKGVSESLAGRLLALDLMPMSLYERQGKGLLQEPYRPNALRTVLTTYEVEKTWETIWQGAWPELIDASPKERSLFFLGYVQTYLDRDIRNDYGVQKILDFHRFIKILASRTGQELRIGTLSRDVGVSVTTIKQWLSVAEASGLIYLLKPFAGAFHKQLVKSPKLYFTDTGLACFLCGIDSPQSLASYKDAGAFFETFVVMEILKSWRHNAEDSDFDSHFFFFRDSQTKKEINLIIQRDQTYFPVEIKATQHPTLSMTKNFAVLSDLGLSVGEGALICMTPHRLALSNEVTAHSVWEL